MKQIHQLLKVGEEYLQQNNVNPTESRFIMEYLLKVDYSGLLMRRNDALDQKIEERFVQILQERCSGKPLQYLLKEQYFYGYVFYVDERVLIPRPETELLVEKTIEQIKELISIGRDEISILDVCTGSGCVIISIARWLKENLFRGKLRFHGVDISADALEVAKQNSILNDVNEIKWIQSDLFADLHAKYDIIVSNPPYIPKADVNGLMREVKDHEPIIALDGGEDGFYFYRKIVDESRKFLQPGGILIFETGYDQKNEIMELMKENGFDEVLGFNDYAGYDRNVIGKWNKVL